MPSERGPQEEQNGANFSSVAPSSEELRVRIQIDRNAIIIIVHGFRPESQKFDSNKKSIPCKSISQGGQNDAF